MMPSILRKSAVRSNHYGAIRLRNRFGFFPAIDELPNFQLARKDARARGCGACGHAGGSGGPFPVQVSLSADQKALRLWGA